MVNERYIELINKKLDGTITAEERADLDAYLAESRDSQELYAGMAALDELLPRLQRVEPPRELKSQILSMIDQARYQTRREYSASPGQWRTKLNLRYAYSFAAGLIIGVAVYALSTGTRGYIGGQNFGDLSGTIIADQKLAGMQLVDAHEFEAEGLTGALEIKASGNLIVMTLHVIADREVELSFQYDPDAIGFAGYRQAPKQAGSLQATLGNLRVTHTGENDYIIIFGRESNQALTMAFEIRAGQLLWERELKITEVITR